MTDASGIQRGDRVLVLGNGQRRGKHADAINIGRTTTTAVFDDGARLIVLTAELHPIPRRPPPDF